MQDRHEIIERIESQVCQKFDKIVLDKVNYKRLLQSFMMQSLIKVLEKKVDLFCQKKDVPVVKEVTRPAITEYTEIMRR